MRKNTKTPKRFSVVATATMRFGAIIVLFFVMVIFNLLSTSRCRQLLKEKGEKEREIARLDDALMRESTRWEEMRTPERIESALLRHGLSMKPPRAEQTVRMRADGTPRPGQLSLAKAKLRSATSAMAAVSSAERISVTAVKGAATRGAMPYRRRRRR